MLVGSVNFSTVLFLPELLWEIKKGAKWLLSYYFDVVLMCCVGLLTGLYVDCHIASCQIVFNDQLMTSNCKDLL